MKRTSEYTSLKEISTGTTVSTQIEVSTGNIVDLKYCQVDGSISDGFLAWIADDGDEGWGALTGMGYSASVVGTWLNLQIQVNEHNVVITDIDDPTKKVISRNRTGIINKLKFYTSNTVTEIRFRNLIIYL